MSILYFWAAIAKLSPDWLDGTTLSKQLLVPWVRDIVGGLPGTFTTAAVVVALVELALAVLLCFRRAWPIALGLGVGLHAGIELAGFKIGIFSYFMFALYTLLLPDRLLVSVAEMVASGLAPVRQAVARMAEAASEGVRFAAVAVLCLAAGGLALAWLPFAEGRVVAVAAVVVAAADIALAARGRRRAALHTATAHLVASALLFGLVAWTDDAFDYYRFWGGSARRLENDAEAVVAYTGLTRVRPDYAQGHFFLGASLHQQGKTAEALASFRRAQEAVPPDPRAFTGEAALHTASGNGPAAIAAAEKALSLNPDDRAARAILDRWRARQPQQP
jgi:hypothetical protein